MKVKFTISYDGSGFHGWQRQNDLISVSGEIENALSKLYGGKEFTLMGSGRTDEGVHAFAQVASCEVPDNIPPEKMVHALNFLLNEKVRMVKIEKVDDDFDALRSKHRKTYYYDMFLSEHDNPLLINRALRVDSDVDVAAMEEACKLFTGTHDFNAFRCKGSSAKTTVRTIYECRLEEIELYSCKGLRLIISANGFLYKMVRAIAGTLISVGKNKITYDDVKMHLDDGLDWQSKLVAKSYALYLQSVDYDETTDDKA